MGLQSLLPLQQADLCICNTAIQQFMKVTWQLFFVIDGFSKNISTIFSRSAFKRNLSRIGRASHHSIIAIIITAAPVPLLHNLPTTTYPTTSCYALLFNWWNQFLECLPGLPPTLCKSLWFKSKLSITNYPYYYAVLFLGNLPTTAYTLTSCYALLFNWNQFLDCLPGLPPTLHKALFLADATIPTLLCYWLSFLI